MKVTKRSTFVSFTNRKIFPRASAFLHVNKATQLLRWRQILQCWCRSTPSIRRSVADTIHMQIWNYLMAGGCLPQRLQHWPGFWALDWILGPSSPAPIRISHSVLRHRIPAVASVSSRGAIGFILQGLLTHAPLFMVFRRGYSCVNECASIAPGSIYDRLRAQTKLHDAGQH